jgi:hypothetical protein
MRRSKGEGLYLALAAPHGNVWCGTEFDAYPYARGQPRTQRNKILSNRTEAQLLSTGLSPSRDLGSSLDLVGGVEGAGPFTRVGSHFQSMGLNRQRICESNLSKSLYEIDTF